MEKMVQSQAARRPSKKSPDESAETAGPIVWAIDAFPGHDEWIHEQTATLLHAFFPERVIHPVYVLSEENFTGHSVASFINAPRSRSLALQNLEAILNRMPGLEHPEPRVLVEAAASRSMCAQSLMRYAERVGASILVLGAHQRPWLSRFLIGSFSETILSETHLPALVTGPRMQAFAGRPRSIIFPTDFSDVCRAAFDEVIVLARKFDSDLHLFHRASQVIDPILQSGVDILGGGWIWTDAVLPVHDDESEELSELWVQKAEAHGVRTHFVSQNFRETSAEAIAEYAQRLSADSPLIAMASGPWTANRLTRDVILHSPVAVYISSRNS